MLSGNQLEELPNELRNCREIELMRIAVNKLKYLPSWIPNLPKLAWLAYSCNDFENSFRATHQRSSNKIICWHDVNIIKKLGEGASGLVYQGKLKEDGKALLH